MKISDLLRRAVLDAHSIDWNSMIADVSPDVFSALMRETETVMISDEQVEGSRKAQIPLGDHGWTCDVWESVSLVGDAAVVASQNFDTWSGHLCRSAHERLAFRMNVEQKREQNVEQNTAP